MSFSILQSPENNALGQVFLISRFAVKSECEIDGGGASRCLLTGSILYFKLIGCISFLCLMANLTCYLNDPVHVGEIDGSGEGGREREKKGERRLFWKVLEMTRGDGIQNTSQEEAFGGSSYKSSTCTKGRPRTWVEVHVDLWCRGGKMMLFLIACISSKTLAGSS